MFHLPLLYYFYKFSRFSTARTEPLHPVTSLPPFLSVTHLIRQARPEVLLHVHHGHTIVWPLWPRHRSDHSGQVQDDHLRKGGILAGVRIIPQLPRSRQILFNHLDLLRRTI